MAATPVNAWKVTDKNNVLRVGTVVASGDDVRILISRIDIDYTFVEWDARRFSSEALARKSLSAWKTKTARGGRAEPADQVGAFVEHGCRAISGELALTAAQTYSHGSIDDPLKVVRTTISPGAGDLYYVQHVVAGEAPDSAFVFRTRACADAWIASHLEDLREYGIEASVSSGAHSGPSPLPGAHRIVPLTGPLRGPRGIDLAPILL